MNDKDVILLERKIVPEMTEILEKRYNILRSIYYNQPIGRRGLASELNLGERAIRTEVNVLKDQGLLKIEAMGMSVTDEGKNIIEDLRGFIHRLKDLTNLEKNLEQMLGIEKVFIVPGDLDEDELILKDMGKTTSKYIKNILKENDILGIAGGRTMVQVAEEMTSRKGYSNVLVVPARGGLGEKVEIQASSIAARLAENLKARYKLLHIPDNISKEALETLLQVREIKETVDVINDMDILVFGIGRADEMAKRRHLPQDLIDKLISRGAVAESFGYYFNTKGEIVWETSTVGLSLVDFKKVKKAIGVAGGQKKAEAIISICALRKNMTLVIDESAAKKILELVN